MQDWAKVWDWVELSPVYSGQELFIEDVLNVHIQIFNSEGKVSGKFSEASNESRFNIQEALNHVVTDFNQHRQNTRCVTGIAARFARFGRGDTAARLWGGRGSSAGVWCGAGDGVGCAL